MRFLLTGSIAAALIYAGITLDRRQRQQRPPALRPDLNQWEDEGGAVPAGDSRTAAMTNGIEPDFP